MRAPAYLIYTHFYIRSNKICQSVYADDDVYRTDSTYSMCELSILNISSSEFTRITV